MDALHLVLAVFATAVLSALAGCLCRDRALRCVRSCCPEAEADAISALRIPLNPDERGENRAQSQSPQNRAANCASPVDRDFEVIT